MRVIQNSVLPVVLSLLVIVMGQGVAASRGVDATVGQMVLCTGSGPVTVYVDADGQPTKPPHFCPEYALTLLGAIAVDGMALPRAAKAEVPMPRRIAANLVARPVPLRPARAPPMVV